MRGTRAQIFTLEGVLAALIVLAGLIFALQAVVVTPSSGGAAASPADSGQLESTLRQTVRDGSLKRSVLAWSGGQFDGASSSGGYFVDDLPDNGFGDALEDAYDSSVVINVVVHYEDSSGAAKTQRLAYNGIPENGAARETVSVALYDADSFYDENGNEVSGTLGSSSGPSFFVSDKYTSAPNGDLWAVVEVEVIAWQS